LIELRSYIAGVQMRLSVCVSVCLSVCLHSTRKTTCHQWQRRCWWWRGEVCAFSLGWLLPTPA